MKNCLYFLLLLFSCLIPVLVHADITVNLDAGQLTSPVSAPMQPDGAFGSSNGSLLLLIDLGSGNSLSNTLTQGNYVSGANSILAAGGFNINGGTNETLTTFDITTSAPIGDQLALRWFPQITLSQYNSGTLTLAGNYFGTYNPIGGNPDGGDTWTVPSSGSLIYLNFYTTDSDLGGTQSPSSGFADSQVQATPEPSTYALLFIGLLVLFYVKRSTQMSQDRTNDGNRFWKPF